MGFMVQKHLLKWLEKEKQHRKNGYKFDFLEIFFRVPTLKIVYFFKN